jgi:nuclear transport factor 2 (NTF2) superfamily protein
MPVLAIGGEAGLEEAECRSEAKGGSWRNRSEFVSGRQEIVAFLSRKWTKELDYRLIKELWAFDGNRIAVRFAYEWHDDSRELVSLVWQ